MTRGPAEVNGYARVLLAPNPGPMTLDGTNSYLLSGNDGAVGDRRRSGTAA